MRKGAIRFIAGIASLFALGTASATYTQCPGCTPAQMLQTAINMKQGTWLVWNPTIGSIRKYQVTCGIVNGTDPGTESSAPATDGVVATDDDITTDGLAVDDGSNTTAATNCTGIELSVPQGVLDVAAKLYQLSQLTNGTYKAAVEVYANNWNIPTVPNPSAHDYLMDGNYRAQLNDGLQDHGLEYANNGILDGLFEFLRAHADAALQFTSGVNATITVIFNDGSKLKVKLTLDKPPAYEKGSARDSTGQLLPDDNVPEYAGRWFYGATEQRNADRIVQLLNARGAEVIIGTRRNGFLNCTWNSVNNRLSCHWSSY